MDKKKIIFGIALAVALIIIGVAAYDLIILLTTRTLP